MTELVINLNPQETPQAYYDINADALGVVPDGTGLQIIFKIKGEYYLFAGPRGGSVLTVNGGAIENKNNPFLAQLAEEIAEETFGMLQITSSPDRNYVLTLNGKQHALTMQEDKSYLAYKSGKYAYITFTAVCNTVTIKDLETAQELMNPTAAFWNQIGNFLFAHTRGAPKDDGFQAYWDAQVESRTELIAKLGQTDENTLLIKPTLVFGAPTLDEALAKLDDIQSYDQLMTMFKHTVGRYSERPGYHIFNTTELIRAVSTKECKEVKDYKGNQVASGIFNDSVVGDILPFFIPLQYSLGNSRDSIFSAPSDEIQSLENHKSELQLS